MRYLTYTWLILGVFFCSSCSKKQYQALFEQKNAIADSSSQKYGTSIVDYHISPHDLLQVRNLQDLSFIATVPSEGTTPQQTQNQGQIFEVKDDGTVTMPLVGRITVAGLTRVEASDLIESLYRKTYVKAPIIDLKIVNLKVTLFGEVKTQGVIPLVKDRTTLVEMLGTAGGLTERADETNIKIIRGTEKNPKVTVFDLSDIHSINDPRAVLQNGDIIYVAENSRAVRTDKLQNFSSIYQPGILLINTLLIVLTLFRR